ncbi:MAG: hypothetical protein M3400_16870, partial [Actinomycetota bacterium]|nr:hypothetical protein [Actinomycetota bacterium]
MTEVDGVRVTTATRTILDLGRLTGFVPALIAADAALNRLMTTTDLLSAGLDDMSGTRGCRNAARVIAF